MTTGTKALVRTGLLSLTLVVAAATAGCLEVTQKNKPPTATVDVVLGGEALSPVAITGVLAPAYMITGAGQTVTLQGKGTDPDGTIASYQWWRTDVSRAMRSPPMMAAAGTGAAGMAAAGTGGMGAAGMGAAGMAAAAGTGAGGMAAPPPPPFTGDPPAMATIEVMLPVVGNYRYSLWVTDDDGLASAPASVTLVVR